MKFFLVSAVFVFVGLASCQPSLRPLGIIDGEDADIKEFPYQVSVRFVDNHVCGGAIISPKHVVTVAKCVDGTSGPFFSVYAGSSNKTGGGEQHAVESFRIHSKYDKYNDNDIAILTLGSSLTFGPTIQAVKLPEENQEYKAGEIAAVTGWGSKSEDGQYQDILQKVTLPIVDRALCKKEYPVIVPRFPEIINEHMVCAGYQNGGKNACKGDFGDPLVIKGTLVGLYSYSEGCALPKLPAVYTNVAYYRSFIKETTGI